MVQQFQTNTKCSQEQSTGLATTTYIKYLSPSEVRMWLYVHIHLCVSQIRYSV